MSRKIYDYLFNDSLYKNSIYLMASTLVMAVLGFFFWMINARLFTAEQIGLATTLISTMTLITSFSLFGLDAGIIRYLPRSKRKSDKINTCFSATTLVTIIVSTLFLLGLKTFSPKLLFIKKNVLLSFSFILFMVFASFANLIDSVFIAFRSTKFIFIKNTVFSVLKLIFPFLLISLGAYGIFSSWMIALIIGFGASFIILVKKFNYKPQPVFSEDIIKKIGRFSFGNYIAGFFGGLPIMVLPLMITNLINPETTAYYYMAMMIASLLFIIPVATTQSLFAEGSYNEKEMKEHVKKAAKIISLILIPAILMTIFFGKYILLAFGKDYSTGGFGFLQILALSGIFISVNKICETALRVRKKIKELIFVNFVGALSILGLSYLFISQFLLGVGLAWMIGQGVVCLVYLAYWGWNKMVNYRKVIVIGAVLLIFCLAFCIYFVHKNGVPFVDKKQIWSIGIYVGESPFNLVSAENINNPVLTAEDISDVSAEFVADPFMVKENSTWYMFFEVMNIDTDQGDIGVAISDDGFNWTYKQIVLDEPFHLSYPYVFKWQNEYYMIPESYEANSIRLYKAVDFPTQWSFIGTLLDGNDNVGSPILHFFAGILFDENDYVDSSIFHFNNKWWLFTTSTKNDILRLYYADKLTGSWTEHSQSPIITRNANIARPGGRVLLFDNRIIRYAQDDIPTYGNQVRAFEITKLTTTSYEEKEVNGNPVLAASGKGWNAKGMHHLDPHQIGKDKWIACVDGN